MKKTISLILALALCLSFTACGHEHTWLEATCIEPRTCSECGETEGEALGHNWQDATCAEPKICSRCGETDGEPLAHDWREANYQDPSTCTLCGETKGEPLTPYFVTYGIDTMEVGVHYDYETACGYNPNVKTVGDLVVSDYTVDEYYYGQKAKDGYEYRVAIFEYTFNDANFRKYACTVADLYGDYYDTGTADSSAVYDDDGNEIRTINYHGEEVECFFSQKVISQTLSNTEIKRTVRVVFQVPVGYDGCIYGMRDTSIEVNDGDNFYDIYTPEAFHIFRFA